MYFYVQKNNSNLRIFSVRNGNPYIFSMTTLLISHDNAKL